MKLSQKIETIGCENNLVTVSISIETDLDQDITDFLTKVPAIREILKPEPDRAQTTLNTYQNIETVFRLGQEHKRKLKEASETMRADDDSPPDEEGK